MDSNKPALADRPGVFYHFPMSWQEVWGVLKWVLAALVAGFIGQFGKSFALFVLRRRQARRAGGSGTEGHVGPTTEADRIRTHLETQAKVEKKRAKAEVKRLKKS
jgi:hypothetical protein